MGIEGRSYRGGELGWAGLGWGCWARQGDAGRGWVGRALGFWLRVVGWWCNRVALLDCVARWYSSVCMCVCVCICVCKQ